MKNRPFTITSISQQHALMSLPQPQHPLLSVVAFHEMQSPKVDEPVHFSTKFYTIAIKKYCTCKMKYGQNDYDFNQGMMSFFAPDQQLTWDPDDNLPEEGWSLTIHPDFLRNHPLDQKIKEYGFFNYSVNEALHLSEKEEQMVKAVMENIWQEYHAGIDHFSQEILISHIDLLLNYANRFYNRQFITRKHINHDLLVKLENLLADYFNGNQVEENGLPTVKYLSDRLYVSPNYLSDLLRNLTGQNTQQHIHNHLIEKAKELLASTQLSVSEIAYRLGFEYSQSFSKLFKNKTQVSPLEFRQSFSSN